MSPALIIGIAVVLLIVVIALRQRTRVTRFDRPREKDGDDA